MERISLSNAAFEGNNNVYLFDEGAETTLVDTGDGTDATREQLEAALADRGLAFADVDRVVLTHWHHDHVGLAGAIQAAGGASVHVHAADAALVSGHVDAWDDLHAQMERCFEAWGMPPEKRDVVRAVLSDPSDVGLHPSVEPLEDDATFPVGDTDLRAIHVSGHAAGLCVFELDRAGRTEVLSGDALLPVYTPNVGGADVRVDEPLARYVSALRRLADAGYARAWPGHRDPIDDPTARSLEIVDHHEERAWRVLEALDRLGPTDAWGVGADLFGSLEGIHVLHGPGEAHAHLDHLERAGAVVRDGTEYCLADATADRLAAVSEERWPLD